MEQPYRKRAGDRLLDGCVAAFAWWTVCCNATVLTGGTGSQLLITAAITAVLLLTGLAFVGWRKRRVGRPPRALDDPTPPDSSEPLERASVTIGASQWQTAWRAPRFWLSVLTVGVVVLWPDPVSNWVLWSVPAGLVAAFAVLSLRERVSIQELGDATTWQSRAIWGLAILGALVTACLHLPNTDDVLYVNMAVALADQPERVLFSADTMHGAGVIPHTAYRIHSFELLAGALSVVSGVAPLEVMHLGLAVLAGFLAPLAWSRLFFLLDSRRAPFMVGAVMLWYLLDGTTPFSLSMHAFARLFQGKAVLVTAGVAAIAAYGIEFGLRPSVKSFAWLAAAQIAGLGLSATGIWLCPLVAVTSVAATQSLWRRGLGNVALACLSSGYVLAMGVWVIFRLQHGSGAASSDESEAANEVVKQVASASTLFDVERGFERIRKAFTLTFYTFDRGMVYGAFLLLAWPLARTSLARRYIAAFMLIGLFFLCSPFLAAPIAARVTGYSTYPRVTWFLPFGAAIAICFTAPIVLARGRAALMGSLALSLALVAVFFGYATRTTVLEAASFAWPPRLKVEQPAYDVAVRLRDRLPAGSVVVAPREITLHLPLLLRAPFPIMTKERYFTDAGDRSRRFALRRRVERDDSLSKSERERLRERLEEYDVRAVVLAPQAARNKGMHRALRDAGFKRRAVQAPYQLWVRQDPDTRELRE